LTELAELTDNIKKFALKNGADLVGIADVNLLDDAPKRTHPKYYLPEARSVICIGVRINEGVINALRSKSSVYSYFHFTNRRSCELCGS